jgi:hypothetical protein
MIGSLSNVRGFELVASGCPAGSDLAQPLEPEEPGQQLAQALPRAPAEPAFLPGVSPWRGS